MWCKFRSESNDNTHTNNDTADNTYTHIFCDSAGSGLGFHHLPLHRLGFSHPALSIYLKRKGLPEKQSHQFFPVRGEPYGMVTVKI